MFYNFEIVPVTQELILKNSVNPDRGRNSKETTEVISKVVEYKTTVQKMKMFHQCESSQRQSEGLPRLQRPISKGTEDWSVSGTEEVFSETQSGV